ncbi:MAG: amidohydrolase family protein [Spirochaetaceae bacterium]|nr:amidohydrolase family protein [Myxococcales bacterium]MCB9725654.1 amidohydrolase family protein [Spirochaetaceae bacterium]HPG27768.1 amidohydrolase family protein [Myxococcota bacterium]
MASESVDVLIRGAEIVDGTGRPGFRGEVGVADGQIVFVRREGESGAASGRETIEADGLVLTPGFVDPHTHYDAQLCWDPAASPSNLHGVTTVIGGNCGFSIAPLGPDDADYLRRMMAVVEGMPLEALEQGLDWRWRSFGDWLGRLDGQTAVNAAFLVGHCAIRRSVMGARAVGERASEDEIARMRALLGESIEAGAIGLSTSRSFTHRDGDGEPVPSRAASEDELLALCDETGQHAGTTLEFITDGCLHGFSDAEVDLMTRMSLRAGRPLNWNVFTIDSKEPERFENQLRAQERAAEKGATVVALTMPTLVGLTMSFLHYSPIHQLPGWRDVLTRPVPERIAALRDPAVRKRLLEGSRSPEAGVFARVADFANFRIGETHAEANAGLVGRLVREIAAERGRSDFDVLLDIVIEDELRTTLWPVPPDDDDASWQLRLRAWESPHTLLGGSDAGAHLDRMCGAPYTTDFLADCLRGRKLWPLERAVQALSDRPARLFGLRDRGRIAAGHHADLVLFDPATVGSGEIHERDDLPGDSSRLFAESTGIARVIVAGTTIVRDGRATDARPGRILRAGRDTETVALPGGRA